MSYHIPSGSSGMARMWATICAIVLAFTGQWLAALAVVAVLFVAFGLPMLQLRRVDTLHRSGALGDNVDVSLHRRPPDAWRRQSDWPIFAIVWARIAAAFHRRRRDTGNQRALAGSAT